MASIDDPTANSPRVWNRRSFTTNYASGLHSQSVQSSIGIARIGAFVAVVIETLEHKAVSESNEVTTKLTANSSIALLQFQRRSQQFIGVQRNPSRPRCASAIQIVRSRESMAETQPKLHPALLKRSAMISQCVTPSTSALFIVLGHLRCRSVHFNLCAHFL